MRTVVVVCVGVMWVGGGGCHGKAECDCPELMRWEHSEAGMGTTRPRFSGQGPLVCHTKVEVGGGTISPPVTR